MPRLNKKHKSKSRVFIKSGAGFTLIELMVVLVVFVMIISVTAGIFISIIKRQRNILKEQEFLNQAIYAIEYMSRGLRMAAKDVNGICLSGFPGYIYLLTHYDVVSGFYRGVKFINQSNNNVCQEFFLDTDGILKEIKNGLPPQAISSNNLNIIYSRFIVNGNKVLQGASEGDLVQPKITIVLDIQTQTVDNQKEKIIQTTVSQRNLNLP